MFLYLREPNETCLGFSKKHPKGHGIGRAYANKIFESLRKSKAVKTGMLSDLEDTRIFIEGVGKDLTSDMTTNIIRGHLIKYTISQCKLWNIPLSQNVQSGHVWDSITGQWVNYHTERLVVNKRPILLVPKGVVSYVKNFTPLQYHQHFILTYLQNVHLNMNSALVQTRRLKDGTERRYVYKSVIESSEAPFDKEFLVRFTEKHPDIFEDFKSKVSGKLASISDESLTKDNKGIVIDHLIKYLQGIESGSEHASKYHRAIIGALELIFYHLLN